MPNWDKRFIDLAEHIANWSKDPSRKIGAIIVDKDNRIISTGYNGFAKGIEDTQERLENKDIKRSLMIHAEENAILHARQNLSDCKIYIYGYCCCVHCASLLIQTGIKEVIYKNSNKDNIVSEFWKENLKLATNLLKEANITIREIKGD